MFLDDAHNAHTHGSKASNSKAERFGHCIKIQCKSGVVQGLANCGRHRNAAPHGRTSGGVDDGCAQAGCFVAQIGDPTVE